MTRSLEISIFILRIATGGLFIYDGLSKILAKVWSAAPTLLQAQFLPELFSWFADPARLDTINFLNEWGLLLIGIGLVLGLRVRLAALFGMLLMALYYIMTLGIPLISPTEFLFDRHIVYFCVFLVLYAADAGEFWGLDGKISIRFGD